MSKKKTLLKHLKTNKLFSGGDWGREHLSASREIARVPATGSHYGVVTGRGQGLHEPVRFRGGHFVLFEIIYVFKT